MGPLTMCTFTLCWSIFTCNTWRWWGQGRGWESTLEGSVSKLKLGWIFTFQTSWQLWRCCQQKDGTWLDLVWLIWILIWSTTQDSFCLDRAESWARLRDCVLALFSRVDTTDQPLPPCSRSSREEGDKYLNFKHNGTVGVWGVLHLRSEIDTMRKSVL